MLGTAGNLIGFSDKPCPPDRCIRRTRDFRFVPKFWSCQWQSWVLLFCCFLDGMDCQCHVVRSCCRKERRGEEIARNRSNFLSRNGHLSPLKHICMIHACSQQMRSSAAAAAAAGRICSMHCSSLLPGSAAAWRSWHDGSLRSLRLVCTTQASAGYAYQPPLYLTSRAMADRLTIGLRRFRARDAAGARQAFTEYDDQPRLCREYDDQPRSSARMMMARRRRRRRRAQPQMQRRRPSRCQSA
jgi:hypothetical protein